jgi:predicted transcriptional regulator
MVAKRQTRKVRRGSHPRVSVTFPPELYATLVDLARKRKVSVAWIVRDAADRYVAAQPTLVSQVGGSAKL